MSTIEQIHDLITPVLVGRSLDLVDLEQAGGTLRITIDQAGGLGVDTLTSVAREISRLLDEHDPLPGRYTLEVSSPGLERPLRTAPQFARAVGELVSVKTLPDVDGDRRVQGTLLSADDAGFVVALKPTDAGATVTERRLTYDQVERARTVFEWGPTPKPGGGSTRQKKQNEKTSTKAAAQ